MPKPPPPVPEERVPLSAPELRRLADLQAAALGAKSAADAAADVAQAHLERFNDALSASRDAHGIEPTHLARVDWPAGELVVRKPSPNGVPG